MSEAKDVELDSGFHYHEKDGGEVKAKFIRIAPFAMKHMDYVAPVKEMILQALNRLAEDAQLNEDEVEQAKAKANAKKETEDVDGRGIMTIFMMNCKEGDTGKLFAYMKKLLTSGVAYIDGETKFSGTYIDDITPKDFEKLCGEYIGNFITS
jgi:hypothetical protein